MKRMPCPLNGLRNISEFAYGGEVVAMPELDADDAAWVDYVFMTHNAAGVVREWWFHIPSNYWFIAERNTVNDEIVRSYPATELYAKRIEFNKEPL